MSGESKTTKRTVAVDFDGVIHSYVSGWEGLVPKDPPREGALEFVRTLIARGYRVVCHTARANEMEGWEGTVSWLFANGFPPMEVTARKPAAIAYVDDRAVYAGQHTTFEDILNDVHAMEEEHRRS